MLSSTMIKKLNAQIGLDHYSSYLYLQLSSWCQYNGLDGSAAFLRTHAEEERGHMIRLFDYVNETGGMAIIPKSAAPPFEWDDIMSLFEDTYAPEQSITKAINELVAVAFKENDFSSFNFLQWYVSEQHEEENLFKTILDKGRLIGMEGRGQYLFDIEVEKLASAPAEQAV